MRHQLKPLLQMFMHAVFAKWLAEAGALLRSLNNKRKETIR